MKIYKFPDVSCFDRCTKTCHCASDVHCTELTGQCLNIGCLPNWNGTSCQTGNILFLFSLVFFFYTFPSFRFSLGHKLIMYLSKNIILANTFCNVLSAKECSLQVNDVAVPGFLKIGFYN